MSEPDPTLETLERIAKELCERIWKTDQMRVDAHVANLERSETEWACRSAGIREAASVVQKAMEQLSALHRDNP